MMSAWLGSLLAGFRCRLSLGGTLTEKLKPKELQSIPELLGRRALVPVRRPQMQDLSDGLVDRVTSFDNMCHCRDELTKPEVLYFVFWQLC